MSISAYGLTLLNEPRFRIDFHKSSLQNNLKSNNSNLSSILGPIDHYKMLSIIHRSFPFFARPMLSFWKLALVNKIYGPLNEDGNDELQEVIF